MDRNNTHGAVDIVVPVYNGYEDLLHCIESLRRHTDLSRHRVLLIDDCSPDERVKTVLKEVCAGSDQHSDHGMIAVFNEQNRGFSANVNTGLTWSGRDTILLNSDTIEDFYAEVATYAGDERMRIRAATEEEALEEAVRARQGLDPSTAPNPLYDGLADLALRYEEPLKVIRRNLVKSLPL